MKLNLLVLRCKDIKKSKIFYEKLGLDFIKEQHGKGAVHYSTHLEDMIIELYPLKEESEIENTRLGFTLDSNNIEIYLENNHIPISSHYEFNAIKTFVVIDPDNRKVELQKNTYIDKEIKSKLVAQALYEIKVLLSHQHHKPTSEGLASSLAYLLHNEALSIIEDDNRHLINSDFTHKLNALKKFYEEDAQYLSEIFEKK